MFHKDFTLFLLRSEVIYLFLIRNSLIITKSFKNSTLKKTKKTQKKETTKNLHAIHTEIQMHEKVSEFSKYLRL